MENDEKTNDNHNEEPREPMPPVRQSFGGLLPGEDYYLSEFNVRAALAEQRRREGTRAARLRKLKRICENFESLVIAFILAIVIRQYVAEAYKIPTGSMQTTLMGDQDALDHYGDRIVVDKFYYHFNSVSRWDVVVFKYPNPIYISHWPDCEKYTEDPDVILNDEHNACDARSCHGNFEIEQSKYTTKTYRNYVKRCVALPGEKIDIKHGDVYITNDRLDDEIPPKPDRSQRGLWMRVYLCDFLSSSPFLDNASLAWELPDEKIWHLAEKHLFVDPKDGVAEFKLDDIMDLLIVEDNQTLKSNGNYGKNHVGDLKIDTDLSFHSAETVVRYVIVEDNCIYTLCLRPNGGKSYVEWTINDEPKPERTLINDLNLKTDVEYHVSFSNVDDTVVVNVPECSYTFRHKFGKDEIVLEYEDDGNGGYKAKSHAAVSVAGGCASFGRIDVLRDIYYTNNNFGSNDPKSPSRPYVVPENSYFVLGDNSANSSDSRDWGVFPHENLIGRASFVFYPIGPIINFKEKRITWVNRMKLVR